MSLSQAAFSAAKARLRPILMTVLTCVFGMIPLVIATGVGANGNSTLGSGVVGGMIVGTLALLFLVPSLFIGETSYKDSLSPFGIRMVDRLTGKPVHLDISDLPMKNGTITNRNKFILGPSGSGKSFFTNHMVRQYYEQGAHVLLVDTGNSYQGLCSLIHARTHGEDGIYFTYEESDPIAFNPFYVDRKSTRLNSSHKHRSRMPSSA